MASAVIKVKEAKVKKKNSQAPSISPGGGGNGEDISFVSCYTRRFNELKNCPFEFPLLWRGVGVRPLFNK